jgi:tetratricopeptide (TPR) repeat protein
MARFITRPGKGLTRPRIIFLAALVVGTATAVESDLQWVTGPGRRIALIGIAIAATAGFLVQQIRPGPAPAPALEPMSSSTPPDTLPPDPAIFVGRQADLDVLLARHDRHVSDHSRRGRLLFLIDGVTGVGKSALALRLAHQLADDYPDGRIYCKMGLSDVERRDVGELLGTLLAKLGWIDALKNESTDERIGLFRSETANKRILFVFDGARDEAQVRELLPTGSGCVVIVTSRRNFGSAFGEKSYTLSPPSSLEAREILRRHLPKGSDIPEDDAAQVAESCGNLPMALVTVGERVTEGGMRFEDVASMLESPRRRLEVLGRRSQNVGSRITRDIVARLETEFNHLPDTERSAILLLTLVKTPTFTPWVLQPLLEVGGTEASSLMTALHAAHFIEPDSAARSKFARYRFNSFVRSFIEARLAIDLDPEDIANAVDRLRTATLACCDAVIQVLDEGPDAEPPDAGDSPWLPDIPSWARTVANEHEFWAVAEFCGLADAIAAVKESHDSRTRWRVAQQLAGSGATCEEHSRQIDRAFTNALRYAERAGAEDAARVRLAHGRELISAGHYADGLRVLTQIASSCADNSELASLSRVHAAAALDHVGLFAEAHAELEAAVACAPQADDKSFGIRTIRLMTAANEAVTTPRNWRDDLAALVPYSSDHEAEPSMYTKILLADASARKRQWEDAHRRLDEAEKILVPHPHICAYITYKRAAMAVRRLEPGQYAASSATREAVALAGGAVAAYRCLGHHDGEARSRAILAEAYLHCGNLAGCGRQIARAWNIGQAIGEDFDGKYGIALRAFLLRLEGELKLLRGDYSLAAWPLQDAIELYEQCQMFWNAAESQLVLGRAHGLQGQNGRALLDFSTALMAFEACGDFDLIAYALQLIGGVVQEWSDKRAYENP